MPKPFLCTDDQRLERDLIETMLAGLKEWRPDLGYPQSHSDMQSCARAILSMYEIKRRPISSPLRIQCDFCEGIGVLIQSDNGTKHSIACHKCGGRGWQFNGEPVGS